MIDDDARASLERACGTARHAAVRTASAARHRARQLLRAARLSAAARARLCGARFSGRCCAWSATPPIGWMTLLDAIDATGYGLTLGIHSRIEAVQRRIAERLRIGNTYVNRNQIGAVVGVQPFGGRGLSGTGPKAGGPITLFRFAEERVVSINTAAAGGNAALLASDEG